MHLFSNAMVALGASLSAFWIMSANSWMQTPAGVTVNGGKIAVTDFAAAIFNPDLPVAFIHIWVAAIETTLFFIAGVCAWNILRHRNTSFFLNAFKVMVIVGIVVTPLQIILGDASGLAVAKNQPAKSAAMEAHWETNSPDVGAPWVVIAWPNQAGQKNTWQITIPDALSLLNTRSLTGQVVGLREFPGHRPAARCAALLRLQADGAAGYRNGLAHAAGPVDVGAQEAALGRRGAEPALLAGLDICHANGFHCHLVRMGGTGGRKAAVGHLRPHADERRRLSNRRSSERTS